MDHIWRKKTKGAAVMVSNCIAFRMNYINELAKYFPVDVYGLCGNMSCPKADHSKCDEMIANYKFYLAFENR